MPLSNEFHMVPVADIIVMREERQRRTIETQDLQASINKVGLINPIVIRKEDDKLILVAGERRLTAYKALGKTEIPAQFNDELSETESSIIELEENIKRKDLPWQDMTAAIAKLHNMHMEADPEWNITRTSEVLSLNRGHVSMYLKVSNFLHEDRIQKCNSARQAYDVLERRDTRKMEAAFAELLEGATDDYEMGEDLDLEDAPEFEDAPLRGDSEADSGLKPHERELVAQGLVKINGIWTADPNRPVIDGTPLPPPIIIQGTLSEEQKSTREAFKARKDTIAADILHTSFLEWAPNYKGRRFNFVHCDFPYGAAEVGPQMQGNEHTIYEDSPQIYLELLDCFCENLDKFFSISGWIVFWYSERMRDVTREVFKIKAPSLEIETHPLIWLHSDGSGISSDHRWRPRHIYDTALIMRRGDTPIVRLKSDGYAAPTDRKIHPSTKPEPMLRYFFEMFVDENTIMLDPTCGSGSSLRAAESLGAKRVQGLEADWEYCEAARLALKDARALQLIAKGI